MELNQLHGIFEPPKNPGKTIEKRRFESYEAILPKCDGCDEHSIGRFPRLLGKKVINLCEACLKIYETNKDEFEAEAAWREHFGLIV